MVNTGITQPQAEQIIALLEKIEEHLAEHIDLLREMNHTVGNIERNQS